MISSTVMVSLVAIIIAMINVVTVISAPPRGNASNLACNPTKSCYTMPFKNDLGHPFVNTPSPIRTTAPSIFPSRYFE